MEATKIPARTDRENRNRARFAFFTWFFALFGVGTAMLAFLLLATGEVALSSPAIVVLLAFSVLGVACLAVALAGLFQARGSRAEGADRK